MKLSRRALLGALGAGALMPRRLGAADTPERKLLVLLCQGGWDPTRCFNAAFGYPLVDMEANASPLSVGNLLLVDSPERPTQKSWFQKYYERVCILDGMEVRSITHERCLKLLMTGVGGSDADDWPSVLAAQSQQERLLPYLVLSGTAYNAQYTSKVVRVGDDAQLPDLLNGNAVLRGNNSLDLPDDTVAALQQELLGRRMARMEDSRFLREYATALADLDRLRGSTVQLAGGDVPEVCGGVAGQMYTALDALESDLCRCAMIQYNGNCGPNWDQHSDIPHQSRSFEELFQHLDLLMTELLSRRGTTGGSLLDEVTVLVCSEMGRHPQLNLQGGKHHWTYTSAMLFGAGVKGNQQIGGYDENTFGRRVNLQTGSLDDQGSSLLPTHLGATLYALGGVDPRDWVDADPIEAVLA